MDDTMGFLLLFLGVMFMFLAMSLRVVPSEPPHIAVVTLFGKRLRKYKNEGLRLFPLYPIIYSAILIDVTKKNKDLPRQIVRTRDFAEVDISVSVTWTPSPEHAIEYLNHGGMEGIWNRLEDIIKERLREWTISRNWEEVLSTKDKATAMLIKEVCELPTNMLANELEQLTGAIEKGHTVQAIPSLGINLDQLNIGEIILKGKVGVAAELLAKEQRERVAEQLEFTHIQEIVAQLKEALNVSTDQAIEIVQTERGKVVKKITEFKGSVSEDIIKTVENILDALRTIGE